MILSLMQRLGLASAPVIGAAMVVLPPCIIATSAQAPQRAPGQVPYLHFPNSGAPPAGTPPANAAAPETKAAPPAAKGSPKADALQQRDRELQIIRGEQQKAREAETLLRRKVD